MEKITFETVACPLCGAEQNFNYLKTPDRFHDEKGAIFQVVQCLDCTHRFLNPRPVESESGQFYDDPSYSPFVSTQKKQSFQEKLYTSLRDYNNRWKRKQIAKIVDTPGKILDLGCGTGEFLQEMKLNGWDVCGIERDPQAATFAREKLGLPVTTGTLSDFASDNQKFDVITMWHVLEHIYEPKSEIARIAELLNDNGVLVIAVPNSGSVDASFYGENWIAWDTPRHVQHFHFKPLKKLISFNGLKLVRKSGLPLDALFNALMSEQLISKRSSRGIFGKILGLARASFIGVLSLIMGFLAKNSTNPSGATLLTIWQKNRNL